MSAKGLPDSAMVVAAAAGKALSAVWTFPAVVFSAFLLGWGAEAAQFVVSQGLSLAVLAWLQTLPEFAVEAVIAWDAGSNPAAIPLMTANFTGSLRLLVGLGWPLIFFTRAVFGTRTPGFRKTVIRLDDEHAVEILGLFAPLLYFTLIYIKATLDLFDAAILVAIYGIYLWVLTRFPPQEGEEIGDVPRVSRWALNQPGKRRGLAIGSLFLAGGLLLSFVAHPFYESMLSMAVSVGVSQFVFIQWVAPFLSEFPEKVTAFNWARTGRKAPLALMNMVSSNINQWTVLAAMIPIVYSLSRGEPSAVPFDAEHRTEILLTIVQSFLAMLLLANLEFRWFEAVGLFVLWAVQFAVPSLREEIIFVYAGWAVIELVLGLSGKKPLRAFPVFVKLWRTHGRRPRAGARR